MADNSKKVMIIDDNEDILTMIKTMLEMMRHHVFRKMSTNDMTNYVNEVSSDLIIMDMLLSGVNGRKICRSFKNDKMVASITCFNDLYASQRKRRMFECGSRYVSIIRSKALMELLNKKYHLKCELKKYHSKQQNNGNLCF